jgi:hypothetical protein
MLATAPRLQNIHAVPKYRYRAGQSGVTIACYTRESLSIIDGLGNTRE